MNYIITEEELTSLEKTGNPSYRKSVEYVIGRIRSRPVEPDLEDAITKREAGTAEENLLCVNIASHNRREGGMGPSPALFGPSGKEFV